MTFLRPDFLYGLFALTIPVIIHLFNFRRHKKLYFSDISRLINITTHTRKQQKLKHLIVLLLRMLAILFIVLALAGPELNKNTNTLASGSRTVTLFIDNSFSMMAEGARGRLFESARQDAIKLVEYSSDNTSFILISDSKNGNFNRILSKKNTISELEKLQIVPDSKKLSQVITSRNRILQNNAITNSSTYLFSDFQVNTSDIPDLPVDSTNNYYFIPFEHLQNKNIYIDSCSFNTPEIMKDKTIGLTVWLKNDSHTDYKKVPLKLMINNQQKAVAGVDIKAESTKQVVLNFTITKSGWQQGIVEIEDYPITFDDKMYFAFNVKKNIEILIIGTKNTNNYLTKFYGSDDIFNTTEMNYRSIDFGLLNKFDLIILNDIPKISSGLTAKIYEYIEEGGNLLFIPSTKIKTNDNAIFLKDMNAGEILSLDTAQTRVTRLKLSNNLFSQSIKKVPQNADLPIIKRHLSYKFPVSSGTESLVTLLSGDDLLSKKNIGSGQLFILSTGLDANDGNFASHLLFVPIMHGIASKRASNQKLYYSLGEDKIFSINLDKNLASNTVLSLLSPETHKSIIPGQKLNNGKLVLSIDNMDLQSGYYDVMLKDTAVAILAFNYNRDESQMQYYNSNDINELCTISGLHHYEILSTSDSNYTEVINALQKESDFWKLFIIFALSVIFMEILILRFWK